jgi:hypothetical protein
MLDDVWHNDQLEQSCEHVSTEVASEGFHNPKEL